MNILYIAHRIPFPPNKGDKIRSFHQIRQLSRNHTVHLACLLDDPEDRQHIHALRQYCASVDAVYRGKAAAKAHALKTIVSGKPLSVEAFYSKELSRKIHSRLRSGGVDLVFVFSSAMAEYVRDLDGIPKVMDFVDVDSDKWRLFAEQTPFPISLLYRVEAGRLGRYEEWVAKTFDHSIFVTPREAELFRLRVKDRPVSVILNGVDIDYFKPEKMERNEAATPDIVFTGAMDYYPNVDAVTFFCDEIFPEVLKSVPDARFLIVGRNPTGKVVRLGDRRNVTVTGSVPDVRPFLAKAIVAVAPFRIARGVQNKVLEAMAMGVPVVGTSNAFQGIQATGQDGIREEDAPLLFAKEVVNFLKDPERASRCGEEGRRYVLRRHRWEVQGAALETLLRSVAEKGAPCGR